MASVSASYPQVITLAAAIVGIGGGVVWLNARATSLYHRTVGSRRDLAKRINQIAAGVSVRYIEERFGAPAFVQSLVVGSHSNKGRFRLRNVFARNSLRSLAPKASRAGHHVVEHLYRTRHAWLQILINEDGAVVRFSITVTDPRFRFSIEDLTVGNLHVKLGHTRFADLPDEPEPDGRILWIGARRHGYSESYWFGNPGNYQHFVLSSNDAGIGGFGFSIERHGVFAHQGGFLLSEHPPRAGVPKFDTRAPYAHKFRAETIINTLTVIGPGDWSVPIPGPFGPDADYVRMIVPSARQRRRNQRQFERTVRRQEHRAIQEVETSDTPASDFHEEE